mgnify:CR=1 FL=1
MNNSDDPDPARRKRAEEASSILRRLDENPEDAEAQAEKIAFLARGDAERRTYAYLEKAYAAARKGLRNKDRRYMIALIGALLVSMFFGWEPLRINLLADHQTRLVPGNTMLASGDEAVLDAATALRDDTNGDVRAVTIMRGSAFFEVASDVRPFVVSIGDVEVTVVGTSFEVARVGDAISVNVAEGRVEVRSSGSSVTLGQSERAIISEHGLARGPIALEDIALWREDRLSITGLTFSEAASLVDRRLPGRIVVVGGDLAGTQVGGNLNLTDPISALEALAASNNAEVLRASQLLTIIYSK